MWTHTLRARVNKGVLDLLEPLNIPEGSEVEVTVSVPEPSPEDVQAFRRTAGAWRGTIDAEELIQNIYTDRRISTRPVPKL